MTRLAPTLRIVLLVPLLVTGVDLTRATLACGPAAQTCLEAAGRGWMGVAALVLVPLYAVAIAIGLTRVARTREPQPAGFGERWLLGTGAMLAASAGQVALSGAALGGTWAGMLALCVAAGAVLALALRVREAVAGLRPRAPRVPGVSGRVITAVAEGALAGPRSAAAPERGRGPPVA